MHPKPTRTSHHHRRASTNVALPPKQRSGPSSRGHVERAAPREGEDAEACLLQTPDWDFDWQQFYFYDAASGAAPRVSGGDTLVLTCTYNNTLDNPGVQKALQEYGYTEPVDISLGEGSLNEMCIALIGVIPE